METEFIKGYMACQYGKPCPEGASQDFIRGYSTCYTEQEQEANRAFI